jgi:hypothetical protein
MKDKKQALLKSAVVGMVLLIMPIAYGSAASVLEVTLNEMLQQSQFVFEGRVMAAESRENDGKRIHTYVTFEIMDVIKGEYQSNIITLRFLGGTVGDVTLSVSDMQMPRQGEQGIYFVESLERNQVHPLYGWSQGHFIVVRDASGIARVMTSRGLPVTGVKDETPAGQAGTGLEQALSHGASRDVVVGQAGEDHSGLTVDAFKKILRERMGKSR